MTPRAASIIIGNYNYGRFLAAAIGSALAQTYPETEVIVVDDGSTDDSRKVIAGYGTRITAVLQANGGMGSTYNAGFPRSSGDVVLFLDADDTLSADAVASVMPVFDSGVVKVHWPLKETDRHHHPTGRLVPARPLPSGDFREAVVRDGPDVYLSPPTSGNAWSRSFLESVLPMPEADFRQHADIYLATLAAAAGEIRAVDRPLGYYRVHGANDYAGLPAIERNRRNLDVYRRRCHALHGYLLSRGVDTSIEDWTGPGSAYSWMYELDVAATEMTALVPPGATMILVDDGQWDDGGGFIPGRRCVPFLERNGQYFGPPPDDQTASRELEKMRERGASFLAVAAPAFWWLDHYQQFFARIESVFSCLLRNQRLVLFDLRR